MRVLQRLKCCRQLAEPGIAQGKLSGQGLGSRALGFKG